MEPMLAGRPGHAFGIHGLQQQDMGAIYQPLDFVGLNIYAPKNYNDRSDGTSAAAGHPRNALGWIIDERVMYWDVRFVYERYGLPIMITENGVAENDAVCLDGNVHDPMRTDFIRRYLRQLKRATTEGIPVIGYQHWSIMDNFEWVEGYDPRFGLIYVDFSTGQRIIKDSAWEYKRIIDTNGENL